MSKNINSFSFYVSNEIIFAHYLKNNIHFIILIGKRFCWRTCLLYMGKFCPTMSCSSYMYCSTFLWWCCCSRIGLKYNYNNSYDYWCFFQASKFPAEFDRRIFAVALSDSPMKAYVTHFDKNLVAMLKKVRIRKREKYFLRNFFI